MDEPLNNHAARKLFREISEHGVVLFSGHCRKRMKERDISAERIISALRNGFVEGTDFEQGTWRYRVVSRRLYVVAAFADETQAVVVTTWEKER